MEATNSSKVDTSSAPKRYTPPNQRNTSSTRRRARGSSHSNEGKTSQTVAAAFQREHSSPKIISLEGCSRSEAYQLLSDRWAAAMHLYNDPTVDLSERPVMYNGGDLLSDTKTITNAGFRKQDITSTKVAK